MNASVEARWARAIIMRPLVPSSVDGKIFETELEQIPGSGIEVSFMQIAEEAEGIAPGMYLATSVQERVYGSSEAVRGRINDFVVTELAGINLRPANARPRHGIDMGSAVKLMPAYVCENGELILRAEQATLSEIIRYLPMATIKPVITSE